MFKKDTNISIHKEYEKKLEKIQNIRNEKLLKLNHSILLCDICKNELISTGSFVKTLPIMSNHFNELHIYRCSKCCHYGSYVDIGLGCYEERLPIELDFYKRLYLYNERYNMQDDMIYSFLHLFQFCNTLQIYLVNFSELDLTGDSNLISLLSRIYRMNDTPNVGDLPDTISNLEQDFKDSIDINKFYILPIKNSGSILFIVPVCYADKYDEILKCVKRCNAVQTINSQVK